MERLFEVVRWNDARIFLRQDRVKLRLAHSLADGGPEDVWKRLPVVFQADLLGDHLRQLACLHNRLAIG